MEKDFLVIPTDYSHLPEAFKAQYMELDERGNVLYFKDSRGITIRIFNFNQVYRVEVNPT